MLTKTIRRAFLIVCLFCACAACTREAPTGAADTRRFIPRTDAASFREMLAYPDDDRDVQKKFAAVMLGAIRDQDASDALRRCVAVERAPAVRSACVWALGEIGDSDSVDALIDAASGHDERVRTAAYFALARLRDKQGWEFLEKPFMKKGAAALDALRAVAQSDAPDAGRLLAAFDPGDPSRFGDEGLPYLPAGGTTWYVDASRGRYDAPGTEDAPLRTIAKAVERLRAGAGDRVFATSGDAGEPFRETVTIRADQWGTPNAPTVLAAWPGQPAPILDGAKGGETPLEDGIHAEADFIHIRGFVIRNYADSGIDIQGSFGSVTEECTVTRCERHGIFLYYAPAGTILNARVDGCGYQGISIRSSPRAAVLGGRSTGNGWEGLLFLYDTDDALVNGFTATGNRRGIAFITGSERGRVVASRSVENRETDFTVEGGSSAETIASTIGRAS